MEEGACRLPLAIGACSARLVHLTEHMLNLGAKLCVAGGAAGLLCKYAAELYQVRDASSSLLSSQAGGIGISASLAFPSLFCSFVQSAGRASVGGSDYFCGHLIVFGCVWKTCKDAQ